MKNSRRRQVPTLLRLGDFAVNNYGPGETTIRKNACVLPDKL